VQLLTLLAGAVVALSAFYLLGFGAVAVAGPTRALRFLKHFASTLRLHVLELLVRMVVGAAFVGYAPHMPFGSAFYTLGAVLVVTTLALAVLPWRWHQRIAQASVPAVEPYLRLVGIASLAAGAFVLWALAAGVTG
jgi:uncharacterized protein YjeT (DUF2065 family)